MIAKRPELLLVGLDNPQSTDPRCALFPDPAGCSGHRLLEMMRLAGGGEGFARHQYLQIPKTNLFPVGSSVKCGKAAVASAGELLRWQLRGQNKRVVLLGDVVRKAVMVELSGECEHPMMSWVRLLEGDSTRYAWIPHPSGRNHFYNKRDNALAVGKFLRSLV